MIEYLLTCEQCKAHLHMGRAFHREKRFEEFYIFTGDQYQPICTFLITHEGHPMRMIEAPNVQKAQEGV